MFLRSVAALLAFVMICGRAHAAVVINEIFYHAPDDLDNLQFIELFNTGDKAVDLNGWKFSKGVKYQFPPSAKIEANGYLVICKNQKEFKKHYGFDAAGQFEGSLSHNKDHIELVNAAGKKMDSVKYGSRAPWPVAADGYGSSLERICPTAPQTGPENWAPSPLSGGAPKPRGTPGKKNTTFAPRLPPAIAKVTFTPSHAGPNQEVHVEADVSANEVLRTVELRFRVAGSGFEKEEQAVAMTKGDKGRYAAKIPAQKAGQIVRFRVKAIDAQGAERVFPNENELRPALSIYVHDRFAPGKCPFGLIINVGAAEFRAGMQEMGFRFNFGGANPTPPPRGNSAFVYVDQKTGEPEVFDFISITPRSGGRRIRLHKDHPLGDMTTFVLIYEAMDRYALAESMAYEVYHQAGNAAPRTNFLRTWIDGRPIGFQFQIEQPNKAFLRHNGLHADGNLYKVQWFGNGLVDQHKKKTHIYDGHADLLDIVAQLNKTKGAEQWEIIKKNFDVKQVATFYAVHQLVSDWDGYFNNHYVYHDLHGTGKWMMFPWDQDKTWGFHDGIRGYEVFTDMPLTFGMAGDAPPGWPKNQPPPGGFGFGAIWWRPGGYLSKPLLANPEFRKVFLARTKELAEKVYTEDKIFPRIQDIAERLRDEVKVRAEVRREDPKQSLTHFERNLDSLREHLTKRRQFLLAQEEIKKAGSFERTESK